jgi:hypothetical protein
MLVSLSLQASQFVLVPLTTGRFNLICPRPALSSPKAVHISTGGALVFRRICKLPWEEKSLSLRPLLPAAWINECLPAPDK